MKNKKKKKKLTYAFGGTDIGASLITQKQTGVLRTNFGTGEWPITFAISLTVSELQRSLYRTR